MDILSKVARLWQGTFPKSDLVNYYVCGLKPALREQMAQHARLISRSERIFMSCVLKAALAAGFMQRAVAVEHQDSQSNLATSQKALLLVYKSRTHDNLMFVTPPPLQYLPNDAKSYCHADYQVKILVNIAVHIERILFSDWGMNTTDDFREKKET